MATGRIQYLTCTSCGVTVRDSGTLNPSCYKCHSPLQANNRKARTDRGRSGNLGWSSRSSSCGEQPEEEDLGDGRTSDAESRTGGLGWKSRSSREQTKPPADGKPLVGAGVGDASNLLQFESTVNTLAVRVDRSLNMGPSDSETSRTRHGQSKPLFSSSQSVVSSEDTFDGDDTSSWNDDYPGSPHSAAYEPSISSDDGYLSRGGSRRTRKPRGPTWARNSVGESSFGSFTATTDDAAASTEVPQGRIVPPRPRGGRFHSDTSGSLGSSSGNHSQVLEASSSSGSRELSGYNWGEEGIGNPLGHTSSASGELGHTGGLGTSQYVNRNRPPVSSRHPNAVGEGIVDPLGHAHTSSGELGRVGGLKPGNHYSSSSNQPPLSSGHPNAEGEGIGDPHYPYSSSGELGRPNQYINTSQRPVSSRHPNAEGEGIVDPLGHASSSGEFGRVGVLRPNQYSSSSSNQPPVSSPHPNAEGEGMEDPLDHAYSSSGELGRAGGLRANQYSNRNRPPVSSRHPNSGSRMSLDGLREVNPYGLNPASSWSQASQGGPRIPPPPSHYQPSPPASRSIHCCAHCRSETCRAFEQFGVDVCCVNGDCSTCSHTCCQPLGISAPGQQCHGKPNPFIPKPSNAQEQYDGQALKAKEKKKLHARPVFGGANFILCYECDEILQMPEDFLFSRTRRNKLRCGACSGVIVYCLVDKTRIVPYTLAVNRKITDSTVGAAGGGAGNRVSRSHAAASSTGDGSNHSRSDQLSSDNYSGCSDGAGSTEGEPDSLSKNARRKLQAAALHRLRKMMG